MIRFRSLGSSRGGGGTIARVGEVFRTGGRLRYLYLCKQIGVIVRIGVTIVEQASQRSLHASETENMQTLADDLIVSITKLDFDQHRAQTDFGIRAHGNFRELFHFEIRHGNNTLAAINHVATAITRLP